MRALVTGANGFVGKHLVKLLTQNHVDVVAVAGPEKPVRINDNDPSVTWIRRDLSDEMTVRQLMRDFMPDAVYHLAGIAVTWGVLAESYYAINVFVTRYMAQAVREICRPGSRFLYVSSGGVYGKSQKLSSIGIPETAPLRPHDAYGVSKAAAELEVWAQISRGLDARIVRPFNHTGPGQDLGFVCPDLIHRLRESIRDSEQAGTKPKLHVRNLGSVRDFTDVRDVVRAYEYVMNGFSAGEVVNVCSGVGLSVRHLADTLCYQVANVPDLQFESEDESQSMDTPDVIVGDCALLRNRTNWVPQYSILQTLRDMWAEQGSVR